MRAPLPPSIRSEVAVRVGEFEYRVWLVEEIGTHGGMKRNGLSPSDEWSEEITSDDGGDFGGADDDDKETNFSFSPELSTKTGFGINRWSGEEADGYCRGPMGNTQYRDTHRDEAESTDKQSFDPDLAKVDLEPSRAVTDTQKDFTKMVACNMAQTAALKENIKEGKNLNEGDKVSSEGNYNGEAEGEIRCLQPQSELCPKQLTTGVGPSHNLGPLLLPGRCNKKIDCPTAQPPLQTPDKYSRVYVRQKYPLNKPSNMQFVEK